MGERLNVRAKIIKLLEGNRDIYLRDLGLGKNPFKTIPKAQAIKEMRSDLDFIKNKTASRTQSKQRKEGSQNGRKYWQMVFNDDKNLVFIIHEELLQLHDKSTNGTIEKRAKDRRDVAPKKMYKWPANAQKDA